MLAKCAPIGTPLGLDMARPLHPRAPVRSLFVVLALAAPLSATAPAPRQEAAPDSAEGPVALERPAVHRYSELQGIEVRDGADAVLGKLVGTVFEPSSGHLRYAILSFGGTLGIGEEQVAVPWEVMQRSRVVGEAGNELAARRVEVEWSAELLREAPRFGADERRVLGGEWRRRVHEHFGLEIPERDPRDGLLGTPAEVLGHPVFDDAGEPFGDLRDLLVDWRRGRFCALVVGNGGVAGIGERQRLGAWVEVGLSRDEEGAARLHWGIPRERFERAPDYQDQDWAKICRLESVEALYRAFGHAYPSGEPLDPE